MRRQCASGKAWYALSRPADAAEQQRRSGFAFHSFGTRLIKYRLHSFVLAGAVTNALRRLDQGRFAVNHPDDIARPLRRPWQTALLRTWTRRRARA
jgi:hypothetical protein